MTAKKQLAPPMLLLSIGLLLVVLPLLINNFIKVSDFLRGLSMGIGLVLEIAAFVMIKKAAAETNKGTETNS